MDLSPLFNRLKKNEVRLKNYIKKNKIGAYRLYDRDIPEFPLIIEKYHDVKTKKNYAAVWVRWEKIDKEEKKESVNKELPLFLKEYFLIEQVFFKERKRQRIEEHEQYHKQDDQSFQIKIEEGNAIYQLNLSDYLDVGLFLDHRPLRLELFNHRPKTVLNLFSYTCSLGVAYALRGAKVTNVDLSKKYLAWGEQNFKNNKLGHQHLFIASDIRAFLIQNRTKYDLIIIDAPTFSNSKGPADFDVQLDHEELIQLAHQNLSKQGEIIFSCNLKNFKLESKLPFKDFTIKSIPPDFQNKCHYLYRFNQE